ncbi:hypothetical protein [Ureibacillus chungkukjangi]|uniref:hypothetical protein n=2 Tax=Ureibacillus chungkukjangi TaxID=1202712 RepID=UPI000D3424CD|nr:hypothetical protein [Ureibacillus chungkukjangi]
MIQNTYGTSALQYTKFFLNDLQDQTQYYSTKISADFFISLGKSSFKKPSFTALTLLMCVSRYVDVDFKIQTSWDNIYQQVGIRSDLFVPALKNLISLGFIVKKHDGYYVTEKSHVLISKGTDTLFIPNFKLLSDYKFLKTLKPKMINFLYFLLGKSISPKANYTRTYDVCSLYKNHYQKDNVGFDLFKTLKGLLTAIIVLARKGLLEATFLPKSNTGLKDSYFFVNINDIKNLDDEEVMNRLLSYLGYTYTEDGRLGKNPGVNKYKITLKVCEFNSTNNNISNLAEFEKELSIYSLSIENIFSHEDIFKLDDNAINLFINLKKNLISLVGPTISVKIYRDALRYFLSEKHNHLYAYNVTRVEKAGSIFKKYYLMPYLKQTTKQIIERIRLESDFFFENEDIKVAEYNTLISHENFKGILKFIGDHADIITLKETLDMFNEPKVHSLISEYYPSALSGLENNMNEKIYNLYAKYVIENNVKMDIQTFKNNVIENVMPVLESHAKVTFEALISQFVESYDGALKHDSIKQETEKYHYSIAALHKTYIRSQIEYVLKGETAMYNNYAPAVLQEVYESILESKSVETLVNLTNEQQQLLIKQAKTLFEIKIRALIQVKNIQTNNSNLFYNWLVERD